MGLRAAAWPFRFKVVDEHQPEAVRRYLSESGRLAVAIGDDAEDVVLLRRCGPHHVALLRPFDDPVRLTNRIEAALRAILVGTSLPAPAHAAATDWGSLVSKLGALAIRGLNRPAPNPGITVCIVHHNRLAELASALASIPDAVGENLVEVIVLDNASDSPFVEDEIRGRAGPRAQLRIIRLSKPAPQAFVLNRGLAEARFETVLFLDDDNSYLPGGVARLAHAVAKGGFDIAVSSLEIFDDTQAGPAPAVGRLVFLGEAHSAGLLFNAFGDTAMAVHREAFQTLGGFHDPGYDYPCLDWVTLAKAQAAGLRIGALQWPAVRYRRNMARADMAANKLDQEGARSFVFQVYGGAFDGELMARYAQKLHTEEL
jgi:glycosyltransferase involved in cell wall biosynthesis